jgi:cysteine synthase A
MGERIAKDVLGLIGCTPLVKLNRVVGDNSAEVVAKLESFNPGGSVKDRICWSMIEDAEKKGTLKPGNVIIEPTSGNTGIGLAMVAAVKGYKLILTMPETMSMERRYILRQYGADIVLTPGSEGMSGAVRKAEEIVSETPGSFMPQQFKNPANPDVHRRTTAREIIEDTGGKLDVLVSGVGTGGTVTGVGEILKKELPNVKVVAVEPQNSPVMSGGKPGPHKIQGIGAGFLPDVLNLDYVDEVRKVADDNAFATAKRLAKEEGLLVGISAGAACSVALEIAREIGTGKRVVVVLPDTGERYFSVGPFVEE